MPLFEIVVDAFEVRRCCRRPADEHLRAEHLLQAGVHFFFLDEFTSVGLGYALAYSGAEVGFLLKQAQRGIFHQALGVSARLGSDLRKLRFLLGGEMNFHRLQITRKACTDATS